jgi:hypothetical protein
VDRVLALYFTRMDGEHGEPEPVHPTPTPAPDIASLLANR